MPCYSPLQAWYSKDINESGKRSMVFSHKHAEDPDSPISLPCGQCIGCRLERSRQWAIRCIHEASLYENNCFITLTFSPEELAKRDNPMSVDVRDFQLFMKRLRKKFGSNIRFFHCGEYGEIGKRPHYHACLFNFDFADKKLWKITKGGERLYISQALMDLWPFGFSTIGDVTFESAAYVARYIMKKQTGDKAFEHYNEIDPETGEVLNSIKPEYITMSRRPGIGKKWFDKYKNDVYPKDFVTVNGKKMRPPKYYDTLLEKSRPFEFDAIKEARLINLENSKEDFSYQRLQMREKYKNIVLNDKLPRHIDI